MLLTLNIFEDTSFPDTFFVKPFEKKYLVILIDFKKTLTENEILIHLGSLIRSENKN